MKLRPSWEEATPLRCVVWRHRFLAGEAAPRVYLQICDSQFGRAGEDCMSLWGIPVHREPKIGHSVLNLRGESENTNF